MTAEEKKIRDDLKRKGYRLKHGYSLIKRKPVTKTKSKKAPTKKIYTHYISGDKGVIKRFEKFDASAIRTAIIGHLRKNKADMVELYKVRTNDYDSILDIFENNPKTGVPSKVITKGTKIFYKNL